MAVNAGDLDEPTIQMASAPIVDWSGSYLGGYLTYGDGSYQQFSPEGPGLDVDVDGLGFGVRYGRNWQKSVAVFGFDVSLESGIDGITPKVSNRGSRFPFRWTCSTGHCNVSIEALMTLRGRYGKVFGGGKTMAYAALGPAAGTIKGGIFNSTQQGSSTALGYTTGIGLEHKYTDHISIFGEVNYVDLGDIKFGRNTFDSAPFSGRGDFTKFVTGFNYHF